MAIRVTPIGGEPVEMPDDTPSITAARGAERVIRADVASGLADVSAPSRVGSIRRGIYPLWDTCDAMHSRCKGTTKRAFVHIGDAWPLCEIETWRQRAERLERDLVALRGVP